MENLISYRISLCETLDNDNQVALSISVDDQRYDQIAISGQGQLLFIASNGWKVVSSRVVMIDKEEKTVGIMWAFTTKVAGFPNQHVANQYTEYFDDIQDARDAHTAIKQAIAEWAANGGFKILARGDGEQFQAEYSPSIVEQISL